MSDDTDTTGRRLYVLLYETDEAGFENAPILFADHWARAQEFHRAGVLRMIGTFADPLSEGSMAIFTTREAAEEFVAGDPFVLEGVVGRWTIREWHEALEHLVPA